MEKKYRYILILIGSSKDVEDDLNHVTIPDETVNFVDGNGIFMATFYSRYQTDEVYNLLAHREAYLIFNIDDFTKYGVNLPKKYYKGLFPEIEKILPNVEEIMTKPSKTTDELTDINEILDKLSKNNYNTECLTESELKILNNV
jgi:CBS domain-containing protein